MVSRKSHPKSRNGCAQCKRRRIKCDEKPPQCSNCVKHSIECDFSLDPSKVSNPSPKSPQKRGSESRVSTSKSSGSLTADRSPPGQFATFDAPSINLPPLHMDELELLHQFATETCFTLSDRSESHALWQVTVPQEAFKHSFLMREMLAISALHLSFLRPDRHDHYTQLANRNQDDALSTFYPLMTNIDQSNCDAFFATSTLIVVYGFESPKASQSLGFFNSNTEHSYEWLALIKGVYTVIISVFPWIKTGRLSALLHDHEEGPKNARLPRGLEDQLNDLDKLCDQAGGGEDVVRMYKGVLGWLRNCFYRMTNRTSLDCEVSIAFLWPVRLPQDFINRLHDGEPIALIILAHYCVMLHHLDNYWWLHGWATHIVSKITRELDGGMRSWLEWATAVVAGKESILTSSTPQNPIQQTRVGHDFDTEMGAPLPMPNHDLKLVDPASSMRSDRL